MEFSDVRNFFSSNHRGVINTFRRDDRRRPASCGRGVALRGR